AGNRVVDADESKLPTSQATAIATLKGKLQNLLMPGHVLTPDEKAQVISDVASIVGQNSINELDGPGSATTWAIAGADSGTVAATGGAALVAQGFVRIGKLVGGTATDQFTIQPGARLLTGAVGGSGAETVIGPDQATSWTVAAPNA